MIVFFCLKNNILLYLWNELILFKNKNSYLVRGKKQTFISQTFTFLKRKNEKVTITGLQLQSAIWGFRKFPPNDQGWRRIGLGFWSF